MNKEHHYKTIIQWTGNKGPEPAATEIMKEVIRFLQKTNLILKVHPILLSGEIKRNITRKKYFCLRFPHVICFGIFIFVPKQALLS